MDERQPEVHVVPTAGDHDEWTIESNGEEHDTYATRDQAVEAAEREAQQLGALLSIHSSDGSVQDQRPYTPLGD